MNRLPRFLLALLGLVLMLSIAPAVGAQNEQDVSTTVAVIHEIDASGPEVKASVLSNNYRLTAADIGIKENGSDIAASSVRPASQSGNQVELVYVIDTSRRLAQGDVFDRARGALAQEIRSLPSGTVVSVVSAGDTATVQVQPTTDLQFAAAEVQNLDFSNGSVLFNAIDRASDLISSEPGWVSTIVVFSGGPDTGSLIGAGQARVGLIQKGAQVVAVKHNGGEAGLDEIIDRAGGAAVSIRLPNEVQPAVQAATQMASDRLIVSYPGAVTRDVRGNLTMNVGGVQTSVSYPGGVLTDRVVALTPQEVVDPGGIAFFRSTTGLYVAVALAFLGIGLAIYALGLLFASGETSLQGLLDRYSGEGDGAELDADEQALVQTALVKRAVEFSETFAEDRGFLSKVEELLERAKLPLRPGEAMSFFGVIIVISALVGFVLFGGVIGLIVFAFLSAIVMLSGVQFRARRRMRAFEQQLPDALALLAGTLRAGYSLPQGLEAVSNEIADPMGYELRRVMTEARLGREIEEALGSTAERLSSPDFAWAVMAIGIQREVGGNLNELLMTVADTMIARERLKGEVATLTAEGKMSAIILGGLPPGLGFVMWIMNPEYIETLFNETLGKVFLGLGLVSATIGMAWMKKVITINV